MSMINRYRIEPKDNDIVWEGFGMVSANNSSRLLLDYKDKHPEEYEQLLKYMFGSDGLDLDLIKAELGADVDSSSGTEPAIMRSMGEEPDVTRGAGFILMADAKRIKPDIGLDLLYWGIPAWISSAGKNEEKHERLCIWYLSAIRAAYEKFGLKFTSLTASRNERPEDFEFIKYFAERLRSEKDAPYDLSEIKIVAGEEVGTWNIADSMISDAKLLDAVDIVSSHYTSHSSDNAKKLLFEHGKKLWFSEGSAPMNNGRLCCRFDGSGLSGINGALDIATRIICAISQGMSMYEFQPVVSAYYDGVTYCCKQLIKADKPWSGAYELDTGFFLTLHFSRFIKKGWRFISSACACNGQAGGDGHAIVGSTENIAAALSPDKKDISIVIVNNTGEDCIYELFLTEGSIDSSLSDIRKKLKAYKSTGSGSSEDFGTDFFLSDSIRFSEEESLLTISYRLSPWSIATLSTSDPGELPVYGGKEQDDILHLPYQDDFSGDFSYRGGAPFYFTDEGGAFEITALGTDNEGVKNYLMQRIHRGIIPEDWAYTPAPITNIGDDRWFDYSVEAFVCLDDAQGPADVYAGVGTRYNLADIYYSGVSARIYADGRAVLLLGDKELASKQVLLNKSAHLMLSSKGTVHTLFIDGKELLSVDAGEESAHGGRAALISSYDRNLFSKLSITPLEDDYYIKRIDAFDNDVKYRADSGKRLGDCWEFNGMSGFRLYNRTSARGTEGAICEYMFLGRSISVLAESLDDTVIMISLDGKEERIEGKRGGNRSSVFFRNMETGYHSLRIRVIKGSLLLDSFEIR